MKYIIVILSTAVISIISSCSESQRNDKSSNTKVGLNSDSAIIVGAEALMKEYGEKHFKSLVKQIITVDKRIVECFYENKSPKILNIKTFASIDEEGYLADTSTEMFYFGENNGFPIIYTYDLPLTQETSVQIITQNRVVVSYLLKNGKFSYLNNLDSIDKESKISALMFLIVQNIPHFEGLDFKIVKPSISSMPVIVVLKKLQLYTNPNFKSKVKKEINPDELLYFLNFNKPKDLDGKDFVWYEVATEDKKIKGWILGNETNIKYYTDGD